MIWVLACTESPSLPPPPAGVLAEGVSGRIAGMEGDWLVRGGTVLLAGGVAKAAEVVVEGSLSIAAQRSEWDLRGRTAKFTGDVVVTREGVEIRCGLLEVVYKDADKLDTVRATGGVRVNREGREATAETAEIHGETGEIVLTGSPSLSEGPNRLVGERIRLFLDDERAICEGGPSTPCRLVVAGSALK